MYKDFYQFSHNEINVGQVSSMPIDVVRRDGYTAYMMSNAHAISAVMYKALRYDPINDFQMVSMVASRSCGRARLSRSRSRGRAGCGARQSWKIQFRQRRRRYDPAFCRRADEA